MQGVPRPVKIRLKSVPPHICVRPHLPGALLTLQIAAAFGRGKVSIRTSSTTTRDRNLQFRGAVSTGGSPLDFLLFLSSSYVQFSKTSPLKSGENSEKSSGENRVKSCHVCGCHGFFGPESIIIYASWGPIFWPFLRSPARVPTIKGVMGTVAIKGIFGN